MIFLDEVPEAARRVFEDGWFFAGDDQVSEAATKLISDERMRCCWVKLVRHSDPNYRDESGDYGWAETFLVTAVSCFDAALNPGAGWLRMTRREQGLWESDFQSAVDRLQCLIKEGPLPDSQTEIASFMSDLTAFERRVMQDTPIAPEQSGEDYWRREADVHGGENLTRADFEEMLDRPDFHFSAVLDRYSRAQLRSARADRQQLKKPRDAKAERTRFLQDMTDCCYDLCGTPMQDVVATTGAVLFEDEAITARLVRMHTEHLRSRDF